MKIKLHHITIGLALTVIAAAPGLAAPAADDFASGHMHFDAKAIDTDGDGMISKAEFTAYGEKNWALMSHGAKTIKVSTAATDFARGNMNMNADAMDTDHDGSISKEEFFKYAEAAFDKMKDAKGQMSVADAATNFARAKPAT
jgi:Ca2+-binding EF-hand superfamily protein